MNLPQRWQYAGYRKPFALYTDHTLVVSFQMLQPSPGEVSLHASISRVDGRRPALKDVKGVQKDFFNVDLARVEEINTIYKCPDTVRNLWQKVNVSVLTGDLLTPEMEDAIGAAKGN